MLVVNPDLKVDSVKDLVALAKAKPGELNYASAGIGSFQHLGGELFKLTAGVNIVHVPYKGGGPAMQDVIGGNVKIMFSSLIQTTPFIKSGQLRALGIGGLKRSPILPDVPTMMETGVAGFEARGWFAIFAPGGTPKSVVNKLYSEISAVLALPAVKERMDALGIELTVAGPDELADLVRSDIAKWGPVVERSGLIKE